MNFLQFIKSKTFLKHTAFALITVIALLWSVFQFLDHYTMHGKTTPVPDFTGKMVSELDKFVADKKVKYEVIDSVYDNKKTKGSVIRQDPAAATPVKEGRNVYLYIVASSAPQIEMPKLLDKSLKQAISMLEGRGLKFGKSTFKADQCAGCVIGQMYKGKKIEAGTLIERDSKIDLLVGKGLGDETVAIPYLIGLTRYQARDKLSEAALNEGSVAYNPSDTAKARVYRQTPSPGKNKNIRVGSSIDLFFTTNTNKIKVAPVDTSMIPEAGEMKENNDDK